MSKRVKRIARKVVGDQAGIMNEALSSADTFHGIGARLLRENADRIDVDNAVSMRSGMSTAPSAQAPWAEKVLAMWCHP